MNIKNLNNVFFLGIGGIGMSALARYFLSLGKTVCGYDKTPSDITDSLSTEGAEIIFNDSVLSLPKIDTETLIVYTPAIPKTSKLFNYFINNKFEIKKRAEVLGLIANEMTCIAVSGTHGKTTVTTLISHILTHSKTGCNAFLGGISKNYNTNFLKSDSNLVVVEADEYDKSFHKLFPKYSVVTSVDADHLDIYDDLKNVKDSFNKFISNNSVDGCVVIKKGVDLAIPENVKHYSYSLKTEADYYAENIKINSEGFYEFDLNTPSSKIQNIKLGLPGLINVENSIAAIAIAKQLGVEDVQIKNALSVFNGVKRRFDFQIRNSQITYIDDYAHHPEELKAAISSIKEMFPTKKITGIFQPHLYSRTRDFADGFAESLSLLDELILLDIYPARELPIEGVSSEIIFNKVTLKNKVLCSKNELLHELENKEIQVLVTFGAGDIDRMVSPIKEYLIKKYKIN
ncbi:MAG: UDP-N-acetylmuramate--L-alanine ligase [Bacteroidetes bacterium GWA2_30_7]|nr:MAG: UDP-N-acetylmuramate--L-alanine ligase [Bacteroidetes bacterium GWA2_30_7]